MAKGKRGKKMNSSFSPFPYFSSSDDPVASFTCKLPPVKKQNLGSQKAYSKCCVNLILFPISFFFISCFKWDPFSASVPVKKGECLLETLDTAESVGYPRIVVKSYSQILEYYWNGSFGKSTLSRGLPSWFKRHFYKNEYSPKGLVELKKHNEFTPESVDWYEEEWQAFQDHAGPLEKNTYLGQEEFVLFAEEAFFLLFALDSLNVRNANTLHLYTVQELWTLFRKQSLQTGGRVIESESDTTPKGNSSLSTIPAISTKDFAIRYAVYHHFRSKGWTPR
jgi:hypothetical protein